MVGGWSGGQESAGQKSEENEQVDDNEGEKRDIEESLYRGLYRPT